MKRLAAFGLPVLLAACAAGGGPGGNGTVTGVAVQASPASIGCVGSGAPVTSSTVSATVSGTGNYGRGVTWSLLPPTPVGALSATTGASVTYTLPASTRDWPLDARVRATSSADPTQHGDVLIAVRLCLGSAHPEK